MTAAERYERAIRDAVPKLEAIAAEMNRHGFDYSEEQISLAAADLLSALDGDTGTSPQPENCPLTHGVSCLAPACEPRCQLKET